jgi:hypothetical protein
MLICQTTGFPPLSIYYEFAARNGGHLPTVFGHSPVNGRWGQNTFGGGWQIKKDSCMAQ